MTSSEFATVSIDEIIVLPDRVRKEFDNEGIASLADSIRRLGLIHPPVVQRDLTLVAGERRLRALKTLGWTAAPVQFADTLDPRELLAIELEENVKRVDLTWQEQTTNLLRLHELYLETNPEWSQDDTARAIGLTQTTVSKHLAVARELVAANPRVVSAKEFSVARGIVQRQAERASANESLLISAGVTTPVGSLAGAKVDDRNGDTPIITGDFITFADSYSGLPFNFLHCDFPYGINAQSFDQGAASALGGYDDRPEVYWELLDSLVRNRVRLLGDSGHLLFWFSMRYYTQTLRILSEFFWVDPYPVVWVKSDNRGTLPDPSRGPRRVYEVAFVCSVGDRKVVQSVANSYAAPTSREASHMSEKPQEMLEHFFRMFVDEHTRMLDPTCGGGSALRAARALGADSVLGIEKNPEFADLARTAWLR